MEASTQTPNAPFGPSLDGGVLPSRATSGVVVGSAVLVAAILAAIGIFTVAFLLVFTAIVAIVAMYSWSRAVEGSRRAKDRAMTMVIVSAFCLALIPLLSLVYEVVKRGVRGLDLDFLTESSRGYINGGGAAHALVGTLVITAVTVVISVPIGIMAAIYMVEYGGKSKLRKALTFFVDVMTGIPSIVAGLFAYALFASILGPGIRLGVMGAIALSVLMIPIVIRTSEEVLKIVPNHLREAAYALGTPKWKTIVKVVLPTAFAGLITGVMIATARIIGETAPLLVTTGVIDSINSNPFSGRMQNLAVYAYSEYRTPGVDKAASYDRAWAAALLLILIVMVLNLIARLVYNRYKPEAR
jgi:phosphate transport system permease protein